MIITQPRHIPNAINSIYDATPGIPKFFIRGFEEKIACEKMNEIIDNTNYTHYIIGADDIIYNKFTINELIKLSEINILNKNYNTFYMAVCNMYIDQDNNLSKIINCCTNHLRQSHPDGPLIQDYDFIEYESMPNDRFIQNYFVSYSAMTIPRHILLEFPIKTHNRGNSADHELSMRLQQRSDIRCLVHKDLFVKHLKRHIIRPLKENWLIGNVTPEIIVSYK